MSIEVRGVTKHFGNFLALDNVSLDIPTGSLLALLGPSGSGKTTLLRVIAGLEEPESGTVHFHGEDATDTHVRDRRVGFVFQHYALFRHMSVFENVAFGMRVRPRHQRPSKKQIEEKVHELLSLVQLDGMAKRLPSQLSGGQRQRVALARALAVEPQVLLLDEPFGALDAKVRQELRRWLRRFHDELHITSVFVTHDQEEALEVADTIVVMNKGKIEQVGTPDEVYQRPASPFVLNFLGDVNVFHGRGGSMSLELGGVALEAEGSAPPGLGYARPHDLDISRQRVDPCIRAILRRASMLGPTVRLEMEGCDDGEPIEIELTRSRFEEIDPRAGEVLYVLLEKMKVFGAGDEI